MTEKEFKELVLPYKNLLFFVAKKMMRQEQEAEDLVQDTYLKAWRNRVGLKEVENVKAWLCTILRNLAFDRIKKLERQRAELQLQVAPVEEDLTDETSTANVTQRIFELLKKLPEVQATCFTLRESDRLTYKEIATYLNMNESSVKVNVFRARKSLKALFLKQEQNHSYGKLG